MQTTILVNSFQVRSRNSSVVKVMYSYLGELTGLDSIIIEIWHHRCCQERLLVKTVAVCQKSIV